MPDPGDHDAPISPFTMAGIRTLNRLKKSLEDIDILVRVHREVTGEGVGRRGREAAVLTRSGIVLATAAWEGYIEDVADEAFGFLRRKAESPDTFPNALKVKVVETLQREKGSEGGKHLRFWTLAGDGYKPQLRKAFVELRNDFHTPDCKTCDKFLLNTSGLRRMSRNLGQAARKLDRFIQMRHRIAHGRPQRQVRRTEMERFRTLLARAGEVVDDLVAATVERALRRERAQHQTRARMVGRRRGRPERLRPWL